MQQKSLKRSKSSANLCLQELKSDHNLKNVLLFFNYFNKILTNPVVLGIVKQYKSTELEDEFDNWYDFIKQKIDNYFLIKQKIRTSSTQHSQNSDIRSFLLDFDKSSDNLLLLSEEILSNIVIDIKLNDYRYTKQQLEFFKSFFHLIYNVFSYEKIREFLDDLKISLALHFIDEKLALQKSVFRKLHVIQEDQEFIEDYEENTKDTKSIRKVEDDNLKQEGWEKWIEYAQDSDNELNKQCNIDKNNNDFDKQKDDYFSIEQDINLFLKQTDNNFSNLQNHSQEDNSEECDNYNDIFASDLFQKKFQNQSRVCQQSQVEKKDENKSKTDNTKKTLRLSVPFFPKSR